GSPELLPPLSLLPPELPAVPDESAGVVVVVSSLLVEPVPLFVPIESVMVLGIVVGDIVVLPLPVPVSLLPEPPSAVPSSSPHAEVCRSALHSRAKRVEIHRWEAIESFMAASIEDVEVRWRTWRRERILAPEWAL